MNDQHENDRLEAHLATGDSAARSAARRRAVLRGAAAAVPTILTLHSGAALARSSNLLSVADGAPTDALGRNLCVDESSVEVDPGVNKAYDLGDPAQADVTGIPSERTYYRDTSGSGEPVTPQEMCQSGGDYYYKDGSTLDSLDGPVAKGEETPFSVRVSGPLEEKQVEGWKQVSVPRGGLVSATALASFAGSVRVTDI